MSRLLLALTFLTLTLSSPAQDSKSGQAKNQEFEKILSFEMEHKGTSPEGWGGGPAGTIFVDGKVVHSGRWSARIERDSNSSDQFSTITKSIPMDFAGKTIEFSGFLRTENVSEFVGLWMREDGDSPNLAYDDMRKRQLKGTTGWEEYSITLPRSQQAKQLEFGVLLAGTGKAWADDLRLLVDGKPVWDAPKVEQPKTVLDFDHEFDGGSGITLTDLTSVQIENLATLGKVWGFLKYHHPEITSGRRHWDYDLFRIMPAILAARDHAEANGDLLSWIAGLGATGSCKPCATLDESDLHLHPDLQRIADEAGLGKLLSGSLSSIYGNRPADSQFYVSLVPNVGNPIFNHEPAYQGIKLPDAGFQILALYRFWNIIEYWSPYRDVLGENWDDVLARFIPRVALAKTTDDYQRELIALIAKAHDSHADLWNSWRVHPPTGDCYLPINVRFIENQPVVTGFTATEPAKVSGFRVGDVITELDGVAVKNLVETWTPYYPASNDASRLRDIAPNVTRGACGESHVRVLRQTETLDLTASRLSASSLDFRTGRTHDLPGKAFRLLSDKVAYLKLYPLKAADITDMLSKDAAGTKGLIIDIRNYPSPYVSFTLGPLLVDKATPFARSTQGDLSNPGAFHWTESTSLTPRQPHYPGKVVILVDEATQSHAEYSSMALRSAPRAIVVGSITAGADGNVSDIPLPGGLRTRISGIGVFYPDKRPTQRVGIVPDVMVKPTIAGIRAGRDEVLEEAIRQILGPDTPAEQIEKMAKPVE